MFKKKKRAEKNINEGSKNDSKKEREKMKAIFKFLPACSHCCNMLIFCDIK
jgi:hypothetical protein